MTKTKAVPYTGDEKEVLHASLDRHRDVVLWHAGHMDIVRELIDGATGSHPAS
ncbi:hypothetical protein [Streptomyces sp. NPDC058330]|uniref:hypothetical protein n=1 Tax=Streptomyces sp. NPDC058330 TaxID=3346449 RepID=UPI0036E732DC